MKAFPTGTGWNHEGDWVGGDDEGMDLRDYFAARAMQMHGAALSDIAGNTPSQWDELIAKRSYETADAMMKARVK